jgi:hypothetical protein
LSFVVWKFKFISLTICDELTIHMEFITFIFLSATIAIVIAIVYQIQASRVKSKNFLSSVSGRQSEAFADSRSVASKISWSAPKTYNNGTVSYFTRFLKETQGLNTTLDFTAPTPRIEYLSKDELNRASQRRTKRNFFHHQLIQYHLGGVSSLSTPEVSYKYFEINEESIAPSVSMNLFPKSTNSSFLNTQVTSASTS